MTKLGWKLTISALSVLAFCGILTAADEFLISAPVSVGFLQIHYSIRGTFGGYISFSNRSSQDGIYRVPLEHSGQPATTLKIIGFAPGCQIATFAFGIADRASRSAEFPCEPLPTVTLSGSITPPPENATTLDVALDYHSPWDHNFFGVFDGMTGTFRVGEVPVASDGRFSMQIPDFTRDRVTSQMKDAFLSAHLVERSTRNRAAELVPPPTLAIGGGFKILPSYGEELPFSRRP